VRIHRSRGIPNWNTYAITAIIELARTERDNPEVPEWLREDYFRSIHELAEIGAKEIWDTDDPEIIRAVLSVIAIAKGLRIYGKFLVGYSEDEVSWNLGERNLAWLTTGSLIFATSTESLPPSL
jgi:hypothetical protein